MPNVPEAPRGHCKVGVPGSPGMSSSSSVGCAQKKRSGTHLPHAGAVAEIEAMIEVFDGLMHRLIELGAIGEYRGEHRRQGIARASEPGLEQLETLAQQHPPRAHQHVLHLALAGHDAGHQQVLHAELLRLLHQRIERGGASPSHSGSNNWVSALWLPVSTRVCGRMRSCIALM